MPPGYVLAPWHDSLLDAHAEAKYQSFCLEIDANVFPCLGEREGCARLMREITRREGFLPEATWLLAERTSRGRMASTAARCRVSATRGSTAPFRTWASRRDIGGRGWAACCCTGPWRFSPRGAAASYLEVTAQNTGAIRLYQRLGFRKVKTVYKAAEVAYA